MQDLQGGSRAARRTLPLLLPLALLAGCAGSATRIPTAPPAAVALPVVTEEGASSLPEERGAYRDALAAHATRQSTMQLLDAVRRSIRHSVFVAGNSVALFNDGPATFAAFAAAIEDAAHHVHVETYIFADDELGESFAALLKAKRAAGVEVRVIYDAVGSWASASLLFEDMQRAGVDVRAYHPIDSVDDVVSGRANNRNHRKLLVVDGRIAFVGGINISSTYNSGSDRRHGEAPALDDGWRDTQIRIEGPAVQQFQAQFFATWARSGGAPVAPDPRYAPDLSPVGDALVAAVASEPNDAEEAALHGALLAAFANAVTRIWITQPYFVPDASLKDALVEAAHRGVDVRLLVPADSDSELTSQASHTLFSELLAAGVHIYEYNGGFIHAKNIVIDDGLAFVGSSNLDLRSLLHNSELTAVIIDAEFARRLAETFTQDLTDASRVSRLTWQRRSLLKRVREKAASLFWFWI